MQEYQHNKSLSLAFAPFIFAFAGIAGALVPVAKYGSVGQNYAEMLFTMAGSLFVGMLLWAMQHVKPPVRYVWIALIPVIAMAIFICTYYPLYAFCKI